METAFPSMATGDYCDVLSWLRQNSTDCGAGLQCGAVTSPAVWDTFVEAFGCQDQVTELFDGAQPAAPRSQRIMFVSSIPGQGES